MSGTFQPGERVRLTVEGIVMQPAPGDAAFAPNGIRLRYHKVEPGIWSEVHVRCADAPSVTVERVAPPEWPPRPGELWVDRFGVRHFATGPGPLASFLIGASGVQMDPARVLAAYGPLALESGRDDPAPTSGAVSSRAVPPPLGGEWLVQPGPRLDEALADDATQIMSRVED